jgi:spore germination cell wall hydrolase CwlJ-like protein
MMTAAMCLALNMFFEARNEDNFGMYAVGVVTMNRVLSDKYPDNVCDVVWQRKQFSWTHDGKSDKPEKYNTHFDKEAWKRAQILATIVLADEQYEPLSGVTMYHADYVQPYWTSSYQEVATIGSHIFYKEK